MIRKEVVWLGDSKKVLRFFPNKVREDFGWSLWQLQNGDQPLNSRPMSTISTGVFELKESDESGWYRMIYYIRMKNKIIVLHSFTKKSRKTALWDLEVAKQRLKKYLLENNNA